MEEIKIRKRHLPHWKIEEGIYFVTFRAKNTFLSICEQVLVKDHIVSGNNTYYLLYVTIVMPDHVHMIIKPNEKYSLSRIMKGIKGVSSHEINKMRKTKDTIWLSESFDRIVRDAAELDEKLLYMFNNPIKRNLTEDTWNYHGWYYNEEI